MWVSAHRHIAFAAAHLVPTERHRSAAMMTDVAVVVCPLKLMFAFMAFSVVIVGVLINCAESRLPAAVVQSFRYGKFSSRRRHPLVDRLEVPKRWFRHFYAFAALWSAFGLALAVPAFAFRANAVPDAVSRLLDAAAHGSRRDAYDATAATVALACLTAQCWRRFYETHWLSVFSESTINVSHYAVGYAHYFGCVLAVLAEAPSPFTAPSAHRHSAYLSAGDVNVRLLAGLAVFLWAFRQQYAANATLAALRTDRGGRVVTYEHKIPTGGLFDRVSCPHLFCEVLMYMAVMIVLWGSEIWPYVFFWVLSNQCEMAMLNHWWYQSKFKMYPKERRAFIPYIL